MAVHYTTEELEKLNERVCASGCGHWAARGYIYCIHCLHGECFSVPDETLEAVFNYRERLKEARPTNG